MVLCELCFWPKGFLESFYYDITFFSSDFDKQHKLNCKTSSLIILKQTNKSMDFTGLLVWGCKTPPTKTKSFSGHSNIVVVCICCCCFFTLLICCLLCWLLLLIPGLVSSTVLWFPADGWEVLRLWSPHHGDGKSRRDPERQSSMVEHSRPVQQRRFTGYINVSH